MSKLDPATGTPPLTVNGTMRIWNKVEKTDPKHTKPVAYGARKFTTIDAQYIVKRATEQFGPVGMGWGYHVEYMVTAEFVGAQVTVWSEDQEHHYGPVMGIAPLKVYNKKKGKDVLDEDCAKKAMTDALTKALSHLGFGADVFLGLYDDNRYVAALKEEMAASERPDGRGKAPEKKSGDTMPAPVSQALGVVQDLADKAQNLKQLMSVFTNGKLQLEKLYGDGVMIEDDLNTAIEDLTAICGNRRTDLEEQG